jgi:hypothetical protein
MITTTAMHLIWQSLCSKHSLLARIYIVTLTITSYLYIVFAAVHLEYFLD